MNKELEKYYDDQFSMMATQGWADLCAQIEEMKAAANDLSSIDSNEKLHFRKGEVNIMNWLLGWKAMCEASFEDLKNDTREE